MTTGQNYQHNACPAGVACLAKPWIKPSRVYLGLRSRRGPSACLPAGEGAQGVVRTQVISFGGPAVCRKEILV